MTAVYGLVYLVLRVFSYALLGRIAFDALESFARRWRPQGAMLVIASSVYAVTDKPLGWVRRVIPPVSFSGVGLDVGFMLLYFVVSFAASAFGRMAFGT